MNICCTEKFAPYSIFSSINYFLWNSYYNYKQYANSVLNLCGLN